MKREEKKKDYANTFRTMTSIAVRLNAFHINISDALCAYFIPSVFAIPFSYDVCINLSGDSPGMVLSNGIRHTNIQYDWHSLNDHGITPDSLYWSPDCNSIGLPNIWNEAKTNRKNETSERRNTKMNRTMDYCSVLSYQTRTHTHENPNCYVLNSFACLCVRALFHQFSILLLVADFFLHNQINRSILHFAFECRSKDLISMDLLR